MELRARFGVGESWTAVDLPLDWVGHVSPHALGVADPAVGQRKFLLFFWRAATETASQAAAETALSAATEAALSVASEHVRL